MGLDISHLVFDVGQVEDLSTDVAWSYPNPLPKAIEQVKKAFSDYVALWRDVQVSE